MKQILSFLAGACGGVLGGMGMGGGTLTIPLLTLLCGFTQKQAQAANLVAFLPMAGLALFLHARRGLVQFRKALPLLPAGVLCGFFGAWLAKRVSGGLLRRLFGAFLIFLAIFTLVRRKAQKKRGLYALSTPPADSSSADTFDKKR